MYWTGRRLVRGRRDGHLVQDLPALRRVMPALMRSRAEGTIYYTQHLDVERLMDWLAETNQGRPRSDRVKFFHLFLTAYARLFRQRPELNRFVSAGRTYQRETITFSFTVKLSMTDEAEEVQVTVAFTGEETVEEVRRMIEDELVEVRGPGSSASDRLIDALVRMPAPALAGVARAVWALDRINLMPRFLQDALPVYASSYLVNLGSLGAEAPFHHLYQNGTTSIFVAIGAITPEPVVVEDQIVVRRRVAIVYTIDERVTDGFYLVRSADLLQQMLDDPASLMRRPTPAGRGDPPP